MKLGALPCSTLLLLAGVLVAACGAADGLTPTGPSNAGGKDGGRDAGPVPDAAATGGSDASAGGDPTIAGVVLAKVTQGSTANSFNAYADFKLGASLDITGTGTTDDAGAGSCGCLSGNATPWPARPPDAGRLTLGGGDGLSPLAALTPFPFRSDGGVSTGQFQGTSDLGLAWSVWPGDYPVVDSRPWNPGDALSLSGDGDDVAAFSTTLQTGALLSSVTPSLLAPSITIDRTRDFQISWAPDPQEGGAVLLILRQITTNSLTTCFCAVPDSVGALTLDETLLAGYSADQLSCSIELERLVDHTFQVGRATIDLVGAVAQATAATFE